MRPEKEQPDDALAARGTIVHRRWSGNDPTVFLENQGIQLNVTCRSPTKGLDHKVPYALAVTMEVGAEALKTDHAVERLIVDNLDLAAILMADEARRIVLQEPERIEHHGPLLFRQRSVAALAGDRIEVREIGRRIQAWFVMRRQHHEDLRAKHPRWQHHTAWEVPEWALAADLETGLRIVGPNGTVGHAFASYPRSWLFGAVTILVQQLLTRSEATLVDACVNSPPLARTPWRIVLEVPLCLADPRRSPTNIPKDLGKLVARRHVELDALREAYQERHTRIDLFDLVITACELEVARGGDVAGITPILRHLSNPASRQWNKLYPSQVHVLDILLRATALLDKIEGRVMSADTFLIAPPLTEVQRTKPKDGKNTGEPKPDRELKEFVSSLVPTYVTRACAIAGELTGDAAIAALTECIERRDRDSYTFNRSYDATRMRAVTAHSIARLMAVPSLDRARLFELALATADHEYFAHNASALFQEFGIDPALHQAIILAATKRAADIRGERANAGDKITGFAKLARAIAPISPDDAAKLFDTAAVMAREIDENVIHELVTFETLASRAVPTISTDQGRQVAHRIAVVASDASVRLSGDDHFPWDEVIWALTSLDPGVALACVARWDDAGIVRRSHTLPALMVRMLDSGALTPAQVTALLPLLSRPGEELLVKIAEQIKGASPIAQVEELAKAASLRAETRPFNLLQEALHTKLQGQPHGPWLTSLARTNACLSKLMPAREDSILAQRPDPLAALDWSKVAFTTPEALTSLLDAAQREASRLETSISPRMLLEGIRDRVPVADRKAYLAALVAWRGDPIDKDRILEEVAACLRSWPMTPGVQAWCEEALAPMLVASLPGLCRNPFHGDRTLATVLEKLDVPPAEKLWKLLEGVEKHVDSFNAPTLYSLVRHAAAYLDASLAGDLCAQFSQRQLDRVPSGDRDSWDLSDVPLRPETSLARFIFAYLSDIELGVRWRAAHSLRILARLGERGIISGTVACYDRQREGAFRRPDAPFYWLAARLWLMVGLSRIAYEAPGILAPYGTWLLKEAIDGRLPHLLIKHYAKAATQALVAGGAITLTADESTALANANTSPLPREPQRQHRYREGRYGFGDRKDERFHFDSMDTLPYWYEPVLKIFVDVTGSEFIACAEKWIVDEWGVTEDTWRWTDEKRRGRMGEGFGTSHRQGSLPAIERYSTHLEWHAMWCAVGEFLRDRPLIGADDNDTYGTLEYRLAYLSPTEPLLWLADLRGPKPFEERFWQSPGEGREAISAWIEGVSETDFLNELSIAGDDTMLVVNAHHDTHASEFGQVARVVSALVEPGTAGALCRALQTYASSWDYGLPSEGDSRLEIRQSPYNLRGWLIHREGDLYFDDMDPLRFQVGAVAVRPGKDVQTRLGLAEDLDPPVTWKAADSQIAVVYRAWGESPNADPDGRNRHETALRSDGHQLIIRKQALHRYLTEAGRDLIVGVEMRRNNGGYDSSRTHKERQEARYDRVYVLRRDGAIETTEGRAGAWTTSSP